MDETITIAKLKYLVDQLNYLIPTECRLSRLSFKNPKVREVWRYELQRDENYRGYLLLLKEQGDGGLVIKVSEYLTKREMYHALKTIYSMLMLMPIGVFNTYIESLRCSECAGRCT